MKSLKEILRETWNQELIVNGDIDKEDYVEYTDDDLAPTLKAVKIWLTQYREGLPKYPNKKLGDLVEDALLKRLLEELGLQNNPKQEQKEEDDKK